MFISPLYILGLILIKRELLYYKDVYGNRIKYLSIGLFNESSRKQLLVDGLCGAQIP
jgi:hypothetical protein